MLPDVIEDAFSFETVWVRWRSIRTSWPDCRCDQVVLQISKQGLRKIGGQNGGSALKKTRNYLKYMKKNNSINPSLSAIRRIGLIAKLRSFRGLLAAFLIAAGTSATVADGQAKPVDEFVSAYRCMIVDHLLGIHERGNRSNSDNRYFILALTHSPQRFVQCLFHDIDTTLLCEASSGRYGLPPGQKHALVLSEEDSAALARLGFAPPHGVANYQQEIALGDPPDLEGVVANIL